LTDVVYVVFAVSAGCYVWLYVTTENCYNETAFRLSE